MKQNQKQLINRQQYGDYRGKGGLGEVGEGEEEMNDDGKK